MFQEVWAVEFSDENKWGAEIMRRREFDTEAEAREFYERIQHEKTLLCDGEEIESSW